jgi:CMP-N,N'-diacetyllegionaminic acid synthase|tara:strand:+ start:465 stop:1148 length:684 start_codon:yes stop_codon:yes gene_type:complete
MRTLVVIPARSGSKGLPDKNIKVLNGKPLIHYSIEVAQQIFNNEDICVSTDSDKYIKVAEKTGLRIPFVRPETLSTDNATTQDVLLHCLDFYEQKGVFYDYILLLQPTSPFREKKHLEDILMENNEDCDMIVSVKETDSNPYYVLLEENEEGYLKKLMKGEFTRRQDCPKVYEYNGSMYLIRVSSMKEKLISSFTKIKKYEMHSKYSLDIDSEIDFKLAEVLLDYES